MQPLTPNPTVCAGNSYSAMISEMRLSACILNPSATPSVCTVSNFTITAVAAGTCSLTASQAGNSTYSAASSITQTFIVTANASRTITYALDGGSGTLPTQTNVLEGASFTVAASTGLTKAGYTFNAWNDGTNNYAPGATYTVGANNITLTATWTANATITAVAISGIVAVGQVLTAGLTPAEATASYQWQSAPALNFNSPTNIPGATSSTYTLVSADNNKYIRVVATGTGSYTGTATSAATAKVSN